MNGVGYTSAALAIGGLEARLAQSTLFQAEDPHVRVVPTTSNPGPLGFFSFAFCCALFMAILLGWVEPSAAFVVHGFAFTFAGLGQVLVGLLEYSRKNVFASNAFLCYGFFWLGTALTGTLTAAGVWAPSAKGSQMQFVLWGIITAFFWAQTVMLNLALFVLFGSLMILFFLLAALQTSPGLAHFTGGWGIMVAIIAFYIGGAVLTLEMAGRAILPFGAFNWTALRRRLRGETFGPVGTRRFAGDSVPADEKA
ncbi:hypothetical protein ABPG75_002218 [Micractinium tetrahymenae]